MTTRILGYVRVSTEKQADKGVSLEAQEEKIRQYASLYDLELIEIIIDAGSSAKTLKREGLQIALTMLTMGQAEGLVVVKLDRLTRSVKDLGYLIEKYFNRYALMSVGEQVDTRSASGRLVLNVLMSVSQWEREALSERTKDALTYKKNRNEKTGGDIPFGKMLAPDGKTLLDNPAEQEIIELIHVYLMFKGLWALPNYFSDS